MRSPQLRGVLGIVVGAMGLLLLGSWFRHNEYVMQVLVIALIDTTLVISYALLLGYCGQLSLSHGAFLGVGAYTSTLLMLRAGVSFWLAAPSALVLSGAVGAVLGVLSFRLRGHYLAVVTLGFNVVVVQILTMWSSLTRGPLGLLGIPRPSVFGLELSTKWSFYVLMIVVFAAVGSLITYLVKGVLGRLMLAMRADELAASCSGVNTMRVKLLAFTLSSGLAGFVGAFQASYLSVIQPDTYGFMKSVEIVLMAAVGGPGNIAGPAVSALILTGLPELLRTFGEWNALFMGLVVAVLIIVFPIGLGGVPRLLRHHLTALTAK